MGGGMDIAKLLVLYLISYYLVLVASCFSRVLTHYIVIKYMRASSWEDESIECILVVTGTDFDTKSSRANRYHFVLQNRTSNDNEYRIVFDISNPARVWQIDVNSAATIIYHK